MFWQEDEDKSLPYQIPDDIIDLSFGIRCKALPLDHAWSLAQAIHSHLPWLISEKTAGIHQIHVAESNNGWMRPEDNEEGALLYPSRRTKMTLRIPINKLEETTQSLEGKELIIDNHPLLLSKAKKKELTNDSVIFSRYVVSTTDEDENQFLGRIAKEIKLISNFEVKKMLCGKTHSIKTPTENIFTRHLMIADLDSDSSIKIQQLGLGNSKELGCGLFLPHKGIKSLNSSE